MTPREAMDQALKDAVHSYLRPRGWTGSMPHFRQRSENQICLLTFQFHSSSGSFVAEVAECGPDGYTASWGQHWPPSKVTAQCINAPRPRLGSSQFPVGDHWFTFGHRNYEADADIVHSPEHHGQVAAEVMRLIREQAEPWWQEQLSDRSV